MPSLKYFWKVISAKITDYHDNLPEYWVYGFFKELCVAMEERHCLHRKNLLFDEIEILHLQAVLGPQTFLSMF